VKACSTALLFDTIERLHGIAAVPSLLTKQDQPQPTQLKKLSNVALLLADPGEEIYAC
jgi:hypothetical protein